MIKYEKQSNINMKKFPNQNYRPYFQRLIITGYKEANIANIAYTHVNKN